MDFKKAMCENKLMNVVSMKEILDHPELYENNITAVECVKSSPTGDTTFILPYRPNSSIAYSQNKPGVYDNNGLFTLVSYPDKDQEKEYTPTVTNLADSENMSEYIEKIDKLKDMEKDILTSPDNITCPKIAADDSPEMKALKEAINSKHIDLDKYAQRFGEDYPNKKRKLKDHDVTLYLMKIYAKCLDMKMTLTIEDKSPDVPNPIGHKITADITESNEDEEDEDV